MVIQVNMKGTNYDIGWEHGQKASKEIHESMEYYKDYFMGMVGMSWEDVLSIAFQFEPVIKKYVPHLVEEMKGIADGANLPYGYILAINCRSDITLTNGAAKGSSRETVLPDPIDGCTSVAHHYDNVQWLSQNWDWQTFQRDHIVILNLHPVGRPAVCIITEAGFVGKVGFNSFGVGVCINALRTTNFSISKLPVHIANRYVLEFQSRIDGIAALEQCGCASLTNMTLGDKTGATSVEVGPLGLACIDQDDNGRVYHTNHVILAKGYKEKGVVPDSINRLARIKLLDNHKPSWSNIFDILSDEEEYPNGICRSPDSSQQGLKSTFETVFTIIMKLSSLEARLWLGKPTKYSELVYLTL